MKVNQNLQLVKNIFHHIQVVKKITFSSENNCTIYLNNNETIHVTLISFKNAYPKIVKDYLEKNKEKHCIILAPYISKETEKICKQYHVGYIDEAGNCLVQIASIYIHINGNKNKKSNTRAIKSIYERSSIISSKILRVLLNDINKEWKLIDLSREVSCSIGQVAKVKDFLLKNNFLEQSKNGIRMINIESILNEWSSVYNNKQNQTVECYSLDSISDIEIKLSNMKRDLDIDYYLTGFSGGVRYQPVVRYQKVHCYIDPNRIDEAIEYLGAKIVDNGSNISFILPYDDVVLFNQENQVVSPVQLYLDLMNLKSRGEELANTLFERVIANNDSRQ